MTIFSVSVNYLQTVHKIWMSKRLQTSYLSQTAEVNTFTSAIGFFVYFYSEELRAGNFILLEDFFEEILLVISLALAEKNGSIRALPK